MLCGLVDWFTGPQIAASVLYLLPVSMVSFRLGRWWGLGAACFSGIIWLVVELQTNDLYTNPLFPYWNGLVRLMVFVVVALLAAEVAERKKAEKALREARNELERERGILQSVLDNMGEGVVVVDAAGGVGFANPAAKKMLAGAAGIHREAVAPLLELLAGDSVGSMEVCLHGFEAREELWVLASGRPFVNGEKSQGGVIVFSDISARRKLERQIAEISDREQRRLGQDLHDGLCQQLVSMAFASRTLADRLREAARPEADEVEAMTDALDTAIGQARDVARGLYQVELEAGGLSSALEELAMGTQSRYGIACTFDDHVSVPIAETFVAVEVFRIAQEAVSNAIKHAKATRISIFFEADANQVTLRIEDNGGGFSRLDHGNKGMGLHIMRYRARIIGANWVIDSNPDGGTLVTCSWQRREGQLGIPPNGNQI